MSYGNDGGNFSFFVYDLGVFRDVPFGIKWQLTNGKLVCQLSSDIVNNSNRDYNSLLNNIMNSYCSYIEGYIDLNTGEKSTLPLYSLKLRTNTHNVFTSIYYVLAATQPLSIDNITDMIKTKFNFTDINYINSNYHGYFYSNPLARKLVILETKIIFWWYFLSICSNFLKNNNQKSNHMSAIIFYLWIFRNIDNINQPKIPGKEDKLLPSFDSYIKLIDNADLKDHYILRYSPKYLSIEQLITKPKKIFKVFQKD